MIIKWIFFLFCSSERRRELHKPITNCSMWNSIGDWMADNTLEAERGSLSIATLVNGNEFIFVYLVRRRMSYKKTSLPLNTNTSRGRWSFSRAHCANTNTNRCSRHLDNSTQRWPWRHRSTCDSFGSVDTYASHSVRFRSTLIICCCALVLPL